jgi:hypothetical protein
MAALTFIPKTGIEPARRETYDKAYYHARSREPTLTWSNWIRRGLDTAAREELKLEGCPMCTALRPRQRRRRA